jgi:uncharacterized membrane protein YfcA
VSPIYFAPFIFFFISLVFSMLGMGGSQLYVPILFWLGMDFKTEAIPLGLMLNVISSGSAAVVYARRRLIDWKTALPLALAMTICAPLGAWLNFQIPTRPIILLFALFTATSAVLMLSGWQRKAGRLPARKRLIMGITVGAGLGLLTGLIGRGGGSFVTPVLYISGLAPRIAAATSSLVITFSASSGFLAHLLSAARPDWLLWGLCAGAVLAGSQIGSRLMAHKLKGGAIKLIFGVVLLIVAALLIFNDVL